MLDELLYSSSLFDLYGALLTEKQQSCLRLHLFEDLSLSEIGEELGISRQAVHDMLKRSAQTMEAYEERLGLLAKQKKEREALTRIYEELLTLHFVEGEQGKVILDKLAAYTDLG